MARGNVTASPRAGSLTVYVGAPNTLVRAARQKPHLARAPITSPLLRAGTQKLMYVPAHASRPPPEQQEGNGRRVDNALAPFEMVYNNVHYNQTEY